MAMQALTVRDETGDSLNMSPIDSERPSESPDRGSSHPQDEVGSEKGPLALAHDLPRLASRVFLGVGALMFVGGDRAGVQRSGGPGAVCLWARLRCCGLFRRPRVRGTRGQEVR